MTKKEALDLFYKNYNQIKRISRNVEREIKPKGIYHEDITHEFYLKIYAEIEKIEEKPEEVIKFVDRFYWGKSLKVYRAIKNLFLDLLDRENKYISFDFNKMSLNERKKLIQQSQEQVQKKTIDEKVDEIVDTFYWFDKKLFNLYRYQFKTHKAKMSKATNLSVSTIYRTVKRCKIKIKKALKNEYFKK